MFEVSKLEMSNDSSDLQFMNMQVAIHAFEVSKFLRSSETSEEQSDLYRFLGHAC